MGISPESKDESQARIVTSFVDIEEDLHRVASATCSIYTKYSETRYGSATAFFILPTILLTAGHVVDGVGRAQIFGMPPGSRKASNPRRVFNDPRSSQRFQCFVKERRYVSSKEDIAILETRDYVSPSLVTPNLDLQPSLNQMIYIVGYPGEYTMTQMLEDNLDDRVDDLDEAHSQCKRTLPPFTLTASYGKVAQNTNADNPTYKASTIRGMSGSPVVFQGSVIGTGCLSSS